MRDDLTIIYYTSNREDEAFESKIRERLLISAGGTPIISVSQKPISLGYNICVGDVGTSDWNIAKQLYIGAQKAKTKYVCTAEADCLYPPKGYFDFMPPEENMAYRNDNIWVLYPGSGEFGHKEYSLCSMFSDRKYLLHQIESRFSRLPRWKEGRAGKKDVFFRSRGWLPWHSYMPVVNIKTRNGLHWITGMHKKVTNLDYWGVPSDVERMVGL